MKGSCAKVGTLFINFHINCRTNMEDREQQELTIVEEKLTPRTTPEKREKKNKKKKHDDTR